MSYIDYIEIENFKGFGAKVRVPLGNPCVLIGPNNSGKTTVLQALSLWGRAVFEWWDAKVKGRLEGDGSVVVNRLAILDVPVKEARCLWHGLKTQNEQGPIPIVLTVGVRMPDGANRPLKMVFHYRMAEGVACEPVDCADDLVLMETASKLRFGLLHPMSGIASAVSDSTDEPLVAPGRVNVLLGQGQTAQALRNVCYALWEKSPKDWHCVVDMMRRIFKCAFEDPVFDPGRGSLYLSYRQDGVDAPLEIAMSGRGLQQMLLMLAYLYDHKGQVVLVDEPDAHLEILRQRQAFAILREIADETRTQIAVVTHSEVILDEAFESNLVSLAHAHVAELSLRPDIRTTLRNIGVQHYYNAELKKRLLIVEGSTDVAMLREFAALLDHPASAILNDTLFSFYTQEADADVVGIPPVEQYETAGLGYRRFYSTLKHLIPELRAVALFDGDGRDDRLRHTECCGYECSVVDKEIRAHRNEGGSDDKHNERFSKRNFLFLFVRLRLSGRFHHLPDRCQHVDDEYAEKKNTDRARKIADGICVDDVDEGCREEERDRCLQSLRIDRTGHGRDRDGRYECCVANDRADCVSISNRSDSLQCGCRGDHDLRKGRPY